MEEKIPRFENEDINSLISSLIETIWRLKLFIFICLIQISAGRLAIGDENGIILLKNIDDNYRNDILEGNSSAEICNLVELFDGRLASGASDGIIKLWNLTRKKCVVKLIGH